MIIFPTQNSRLSFMFIENMTIIHIDTVKTRYCEKFSIYIKQWVRRVGQSCDTSFVNGENCTINPHMRALESRA